MPADGVNADYTVCPRDFFSSLLLPACRGAGKVVEGRRRRDVRHELEEGFIAAITTFKYGYLQAA